MKTAIFLCALIWVISILLGPPALALNQANILINRIHLLEDGATNPAYQKQIKDLVVFQVGGWSQLPELQDRKPDSPLEGGKGAYLSRNYETFQHQMKLVKDLSPNLAVAVLLMNNGDSNASGYGVCWGGKFAEGAAKCQGGTWKLPMELFADAKKAAAENGVPIAPDFSIMNYEFPKGEAGGQVLPKLKKFLENIRPTFDESSVRANDGRFVVLIDGLPEWHGMNDNQKQEAMGWMASQKDIFWVDNLVGELSTGKRSTDASNVFRSTWGNEAIKDQIRGLWGENFRWWFTPLFSAATNMEEFKNPANTVSETIRRKWMNVDPHDPDMYPVIISQWNEYGEYLIFEPSTELGTVNYEYLKWIIAQQPDSAALPNGTAATGTFKQSCSACAQSGSTMSCRCASDSGQVAAASIDMSSCETTDIWNQDGKLSCNIQKQINQSIANITGSYAQSCEACTLTGSLMSCQCASRNGQVVGSAIDLSSCDSKRVGNLDGSLSCY